MAATLGVATWSYLPYAFFNFASPLLAIAVAYFGVRMLRTPTGPAREAASAISVASQQRNLDNF
jgi:NhaC family Na+:H+ antiporter